MGTYRPGYEFLRSPIRGPGDEVSRHDESALGITCDRTSSIAMARIALPDAPSVVAGHGRAAILTADGELLLLPAAEAAAHLRGLPPPLLVHAPATFRRLGLRGIPAFDLLELFAFALPARAAAPTPRGLALALDFEPPHGTGSRGGAAARTGRRLAASPRPRPRYRAEPRRGGARGPHGPGGLGLGAVRHRRARPAGRGTVQRGVAGVEAPAGVGGCGAAAAAFVAAGGGSRGAVAACRHAGTARRAAAGPGGLRRRRRGRLRAARDPRRSAPGAGGGRHRHRQDPRLSGARQPVGGEEPRRRVDQHLHPPSAAPDRRRTGTPVPRSVRPPQARGGAQGPRELPLPAEPGGRARPGHVAAGAGLGHPARPDRALGAGDRRWRHPGRRPARLVCRIVRHRDHPGPRRPARRVHPRRLPALAALLRRAHDPPRADRAACRRQPCAGDDPGRVGRAGRQRRAQPLRVRRGPPRVRCGGQRVLRRALRAGDRRDAPLAARRRGWAVARPRAAAAHRGTGRGPSAAGDAAGRRSAGGARAARAGLVRPHRRGSSGTWRPGCRQTQSDRGVPAADPPSGARARRQGRGRLGRGWNAMSSRSAPASRRRRSDSPARWPASPSRSPRCANGCSAAWTRRRTTWTPRRATASRPPAARSTAAS